MSMTDMIGTLSPAYGRDYKNVKDLEKDFRNGLDFVNNTPYGTCYISIRDMTKGYNCQLRYSNMKKVTMIKV